MSVPKSGAPREAGAVAYATVIPFALAHLACFAAIWTGVTAQALALAVILYVVRMFAVTAGYHRLFSHKSYATGRVFQFILAFLAQSTAQKSVLWWAIHHRHHHLYSDTPDDLHSARRRGFLHAHVGWIFQSVNDDVDFARAPDLTRYPELVWLHDYELVPPVALALFCTLVAGWPGLVVGFFWSTVAVWHATFCINSLAHVQGTKRYVTGDDSRNNWWLAILTMGEGWHNNHHFFQASVRQGFRWWEVDLTFYILKALSLVGVVRDLRLPPPDVVRNERPLGRRVIERAASDLVATLNLEALAANVRAALAASPTLAQAQAQIAEARERAADLVAAWPSVPTRADIAARAQAMYARTPSLDEIVERAHRMVLENLAARLAPAM